MCQTTTKLTNENVTTDRRECIMCSKKLVGRSDKVFCGISCKNRYHGQNRKAVKNYFTETLKVIRKNYLILSGMLAEDRSAKLSRTAIVRDGFESGYATGIRRNGKSLVCELFDLCFTVKNNNVVFWRTSSQSPFSPYLFERWRRQVGAPDVIPV